MPKLNQVKYNGIQMSSEQLFKKYPNLSHDDIAKNCLCAKCGDNCILVKPMDKKMHLRHVSGKGCVSKTDTNVLNLEEICEQINRIYKYNGQKEVIFKFLKELTSMKLDDKLKYSNNIVSIGSLEKYSKKINQDFGYNEYDYDEPTFHDYLHIDKIVINPYNFVKYGVITLKTAECIAKIYSLSIPFESRIEFLIDVRFKDCYYLKLNDIINFVRENIDNCKENEFPKFNINILKYNINHDLNIDNCIRSYCKEVKIDYLKNQSTTHCPKCNNKLISNEADKDSGKYWHKKEGKWKDTENWREVKKCLSCKWKMYNNSKYFDNCIYYTTYKCYDNEAHLTFRILKSYFSKINNEYFTPKEDPNYDIGIVNNYINEYEHKKSQGGEKYSLNNEQINAVHIALKYNFAVITGPPGTGKTDISEIIHDYLYEVNEDVPTILAPTGIALKNIRDRIYKGKEYRGEQSKKASTCHNLRFNKKLGLEGRPNVIIDEVSMINLPDFRLLLDFLKNKNNEKLIIMGDINQLQSIGHGDILKKIIQFNDTIVARLTKIVRQKDNKLKECIQKINPSLLEKPESDTIIKIDKDPDRESLYIKNIDNYLSSGEINKDKISKLINKYNLTPDNTKFLSAQKEGIFGTKKLNTILQPIFNPNGQSIFDSKFENNGSIKCPFHKYKQGDLIIRTKNDYSIKDKIYANGDLAVIESYNENINKITIKYNCDIDDDNEISLDTFMDDFDLAYCTTIHKAQGSQYDNVLIFIPDDHSLWRKSGAKNLLYTAMSRAKKRCFIITCRNLFHYLQHVKTDNDPSLFLDEYLINDPTLLLEDESDEEESEEGDSG